MSAFNHKWDLNWRATAKQTQVHKKQPRSITWYRLTANAHTFRSARAKSNVRRTIINETRSESWKQLISMLSKYGAHRWMASRTQKSTKTRSLITYIITMFVVRIVYLYIHCSMFPFARRMEVWSVKKWSAISGHLQFVPVWRVGQGG